MTASDDALVTIVIRDLPIKLHERAQAHSDELTREFRLLAEQVKEEGPGQVPHRLTELVDTLNARYGMMTEAQQDALDEAIASGQSAIDVEYELPRHAAEAAAQLGVVLDEADAFCREGEHLLTLATPDDCLAYRRWFLDEFVRQTAGLPPTPWPVSPHATAVSAR